MPRQHRNLPLPPLSHPNPHTPAPVQLTLSTATAPSPSITNTPIRPQASPPTQNNLPQRTGSKRLDRVKDLLSPILSPGGPTSSPSTSSPSTVAVAVAVPTPSIHKERARDADAASEIQFFERHPMDSRNPLTFLDVGFGNGDGGGKAKEEEVKQYSGRDQVSQSSFDWYDLSATPPKDISLAKARGMAPSHDALAGFARLDLQVRGRTRRVDGEVQRTMSQVERKVRGRPMALYEMPGRYRSAESCWHCADGTVGKRCKFCGLVVRRYFEEKY